MLPLYVADMWWFCLPCYLAVTGVKFLVVDLSPVVRSDSSGAHFIKDLAKESREKGIQLVLCNPTNKVSGAIMPAHYWLLQHVHRFLQYLEHSARKSQNQGRRGYCGAHFGAAPG